jgi:hypothetical protein
LVDTPKGARVTAGHIARPEANSTPERAMELLLGKARLVFGEQDWSTWEWSAREYGTREPRPSGTYFT